MLNEPTLEKLTALNLATMAAAWLEQNKNPKMASLSFDERFGMLVDAEHLARDNRRLGRLLKDAQLRLPSACVEDIVRISRHREHAFRGIVSARFVAS